jgi:hypothetical protein
VTSEPRPRHLRALPDLDEADQYPDSAGRRFDDVPRIGAPGLADAIPNTVWDEISRAADVWESLRDDGKQLHYDVDEQTGRVSVELRDLGGATLRSVSLVEALGTGDDDSPAA